MSMLRRIRASLFWPMLWKEFVQMRRDRLTLAMLVVIPAVQLAMFGYAIRTEVRRQHDVQIIGRLDEVRARFYAISVEKRLKHPAVVTISDVARQELFRA